jgi:glycosyltransferase involved in cell wall biosynthesis
MKICIIAKYPPIEGGESSKAYWLARALGQRGHEVHVVTNALEVEEEYREQLSDYDLKYKYQPQGVYVQIHFRLER